MKKIILAIVLISSSSTIALFEASATNVIPDDGLDTCIKAELGENYTLSELAALKELSCDAEVTGDIYSFEGLENATSLRKFYVDGGSVTSLEGIQNTEEPFYRVKYTHSKVPLPVEELYSVNSERFTVTYAGLGSIDFDKMCDSLMEISIRGNNLTTESINITEDTDITYLDIGNNPVDDLSTILDHMPDLITLNADNTEVTTLDLSNNKRLITDYEATVRMPHGNINEVILPDETLALGANIDLSDNKLTNVDFLDNVSLVYNLNLANNEITDISGIEDIHEIYFTVNGVTHTDSSINFEGNHISDIWQFNGYNQFFYTGSDEERVSTSFANQTIYLDEEKQNFDSLENVYGIVKYPSEIPSSNGDGFLNIDLYVDLGIPSKIGVNSQSGEFKVTIGESTETKSDDVIFSGTMYQNIMVTE